MSSSGGSRANLRWPQHDEIPARAKYRTDRAKPCGRPSSTVPRRRDGCRLSPGSRSASCYEHEEDPARGPCRDESRSADALAWRPTGRRYRPFQNHGSRTSGGRAGRTRTIPARRNCHRRGGSRGFRQLPSVTVEFTPAALVQLAEISASVREHHPGAAVRIAEAKEATAARMGTTYLIGRLQDVGGVRRANVTSTGHLLTYTVLPDEGIVRVLAILHGARQRPYRDA